jgi:hypothetical protein
MCFRSYSEVNTAPTLTRRAYVVLLQIGPSSSIKSTSRKLLFDIGREETEYRDSGRIRAPVRAKIRLLVDVGQKINRTRRF